jgi:hypothetical protein
MTELSTSLAVFVFATIVFQIAALRTYKNELLWAKSDYFWLGIAALGIISLTADARRNEAERLIPNQNDHLRGMAELAEQNLNFSLNFLTFFSTLPVKDEPPEIARQKKEFVSLREKLLPYSDSMSKSEWPSRVSEFHQREALLEGLEDPRPCLKTLNSRSEASR